MSSGETLSAPMAHMSALEMALAVEISPPGPVTFCQVVPLRCQVPKPGFAPGAPNTHTLVGLNAVTPVSSWASGGDSLNVLATDHFVPFQCSTYPVSWLTAQASFWAGVLTAPRVPVSPLGRVAACQLVPFHRSAAGAPGVAPDRSVPPTAQALAFPEADTPIRPVKFVDAPECARKATCQPVLAAAAPGSQAVVVSAAAARPVPRRRPVWRWR